MNAMAKRVNGHNLMQYINVYAMYHFKGHKTSLKWLKWWIYNKSFHSKDIVIGYYLWVLY